MPAARAWVLDEHGSNPSVRLDYFLFFKNKGWIAFGTCMWAKTKGDQNKDDLSRDRRIVFFLRKEKRHSAIEQLAAGSQHSPRWCDDPFPPLDITNADNAEYS
jgi:hypothetical protein